MLSIHKLPASGATDISFPMKGWRATGDWAKVPEDRVTVSKSVFSTGLAGEARESGGLLRTRVLEPETHQPEIFSCRVQCIVSSDREYPWYSLLFPRPSPCQKLSFPSMGGHSGKHAKPEG